MTKEQFKENLRVQEASADLAAPGGFGQVRKPLIIKIAANPVNSYEGRKHL